VKSTGIQFDGRFGPSPPPGDSRNIMLTSPEGPPISKSLSRCPVLRADEQGHSAHQSLPASRAGEHQRTSELIQSRPRQDRIDRLLSSGTANTVDRLKDILSNHEEHPRSICRHANADPGVGHWQTVFSVIIEPEARCMHLTRGLPCESPYEIYDLP
jgi:isopenicillin-N N-acyltransferase-like protein